VPAGTPDPDPSGGSTSDQVADVLAGYAGAEPPPATGVPDPETELDAYKSPLPTHAAAKRGVHVTALQVRKPNNQEYVRVMPGGGIVLPLFRSRTGGDKLYMIKREVEHLLPASDVRQYRIVLAKSLRALAPFLWPVPVPQDDAGRTWHESADAAAREAETHWVRVMSDRVGSCYVLLRAEGELPEPEWLTDPLDRLVLIGFRNQRLDAPDHPVILDLHGKVV
jgi:hypothetical protein